MIHKNNLKHIDKSLLINYLNKISKIKLTRKLTCLEKQILLLKSKIHLFKLIVNSFHLNHNENSNSRILHNILSNK